MADLTAELHHSLQASRAGLLSRLGVWASTTFAGR